MRYIHSSKWNKIFLGNSAGVISYFQPILVFSNTLTPRL
jgi:hypothetical protein